MLKEFFQWYIVNIKQSPLIIIGGSIVALFAAIGSVYGGIQAASNFYGFIIRKYFENQILYQRLEKINTGLNIDFIEPIIGKPAIVKKLPSQLTYYIKTEKGDWIEKNTPSDLGIYYTEKIYVHKKYFIQLIINNEGIIVSYAVTTRDRKFNPKIPIEIYRGDKEGETYPYISNLRLGKMGLNDLKDYEPEKINMGQWGMNYFYIEAQYFGNPGFYKHYLLAASPSGCCINNEVLSKLNEFIVYKKDNSTTNPEITQLRKELRPNTFAVIDGFKNESLLNFFLKEGVGPNYYDIREF